MAIRKISPFPQAPDSSSDSPQEFNTKANAFVKHQATVFVPEINSAITGVNNAVTTTEANKSEATKQANRAKTEADRAATAAAGYLPQIKSGDAGKLLEVDRTSRTSQWVSPKWLPLDGGAITNWIEWNNYYRGIRWTEGTSEKLAIYSTSADEARITFKGVGQAATTVIASFKKGELNVLADDKIRMYNNHGGEILFHDKFVTITGIDFYKNGTTGWRFGNIGTTAWVEFKSSGEINIDPKGGKDAQAKGSRILTKANPSDEPFTGAQEVPVTIDAGQVLKETKIVQTKGHSEKGNEHIQLHAVVPDEHDHHLIELLTAQVKALTERVEALEAKNSK